MTLSACYTAAESFLAHLQCFLLVPADLVWAAYLTPSSACLQEMDRAFGGDGTSVPSADTMQEAATCLYFPADLRESSTQYKFLIDLPGVPKSDIKVCIISTLSAQYCSAWFHSVHSYRSQLCFAMVPAVAYCVTCHSFVWCASRTPVVPCIPCYL